MSTNLGRLIQVLPQAVFGPIEKQLILTQAPYVALVTGCDATIQPMYDFRFGGKVEWCKHRSEAITDMKNVDFTTLIDTPDGLKNFKLVFFDQKIDPATDDLQLLFKAKLVVRLTEYFPVDNLLKAVVLRNQLTHISLSEHLIYMNTAEP